MDISLGWDERFRCNENTIDLSCDFEGYSHYHNYDSSKDRGVVVNGGEWVSEGVL